MAILVILAAGSALAQDGGGHRPGEHPEGAPIIGTAKMLEITSGQLGVEEDAVKEAVSQDGATWASVIESFGGDVDAIMEAIVLDVTRNTDASEEEAAAQIQELVYGDPMLQFLLPESFEGGRESGGRKGGPGAVVELVSESLGVEPEALIEALQAEGATLASVVESFGGDVEALKLAVVENMLLNRPGTDIDKVSERVEEMFNNPLPPKGERRGDKRPGGEGPEGGQPGGEGPTGPHPEA
jgi:hypothetical protein